MLVVNAANIEKDLAWVETHNDTEAEVENVSEDTALIALQGPKAIDILNPFVPERDVSEISFFRFVRGRSRGNPYHSFHEPVIRVKSALSYTLTQAGQKIYGMHSILL